MIPLALLAAAAVVVAWPLVWPLVRPSAPSPLPERPAGVVVPAPPAVTFVQATAALDLVLAFVRSSGRYGVPQQDAARVLRAATVEAATPPVEAKS